MAQTPFDSCWHRLERATQHRLELAAIWNDYLHDHPFDFTLVDEGNGVYILNVDQHAPLPPTFAVIFGEWLFNLRSTLDYVIWATAAYASGTVPPPNEGDLQYPIYDNEASWDRNKRRLRGLEPHQIEMLKRMQPFASDPDANYLGWLNRLARIDRHRQLNVATAYLAEASPVIAIPVGHKATLQWGDRVLRSGQAPLARISVSPWREGLDVNVNPRVGIDPEIAEWAASPFWSRQRFSHRLQIMEIFVSAEIAAYEYDCTGQTRKSDLLMKSFRQQADSRRTHATHLPSRPVEPAWGEPSTGTVSSESRFRGVDFPPDSRA